MHFKGPDASYPNVRGFRRLRGNPSIDHSSMQSEKLSKSDRGDSCSSDDAEMSGGIDNLGGGVKDEQTMRDIVHCPKRKRIEIEGKGEDGGEQIGTKPDKRMKISRKRKQVNN